MLGVGQVEEVEWAPGREQRAEGRRGSVCRAQGPADKVVCCAEESLEGRWRQGRGSRVGAGGGPCRRKGLVHKAL